MTLMRGPSIHTSPPSPDPNNTQLSYPRSRTSPQTLHARRRALTYSTCLRTLRKPSPSRESARKRPWTRSESNVQSRNTRAKAPMHYRHLYPRITSSGASPNQTMLPHSNSQRHQHPQQSEDSSWMPLREHNKNASLWK
jgi:hypothetical protein